MRIFLWLWAAFLLLSCSNPVVEQTVRQRVVYDSTSLLALDVCYKSRQDLLPVVVYLHGGGWWQGDKSEWNERNAQYFRDNGIVSVSIDYTLAPNYDERKFTPRGIYPKNVDDVVRSIQWVRKNIANFGGDPNNIFIMGFSAGTHLASLAVMKNKLPDMQQYLRGVILLDAGSYLVMNRWLMKPGGLDSMWMNAFGTESFKYDELNPVALLPKQKWLPPFLLVCRNTLDREDPNRHFNRMMATNNKDCRLILLHDSVKHWDIPLFMQLNLPFTSELITFVKTHTADDNTYE